MLCLSAFELYSRWVPLLHDLNIQYINEMKSFLTF